MPLGELARVLMAIESGAFAPDKTRSGRWKPGYSLKSFEPRISLRPSSVWDNEAQDEKKEEAQENEK